MPLAPIEIAAGLFGGMTASAGGEVSG